MADISNSNPYLNEPTTVVYKLYFSENIGISNYKEVNKPKYNDFWSQNIDILQPVAEEGIFKGQRFRYVVLKKVVLYPQKSGKLQIEPLSIDIDAQIPVGRPNIFGQFQIAEQTKRVSAGNKLLSVKPLPENGKPVDFTGAVGRYSFKVTPSKTDLKSNESLDLNVSVSGTGNLKLFSLPKPVVPTALELYDPVHSENVQTPLSGMTGSISDKYTIVAQYKGKFPIKPISFSYFDLDSKTYKTITSPEIVVNVLEGKPLPKSNPIANKDNPNAIDQPKPFENIKSKTSFLSTNRTDFLGSSLFYSLLFLPFLIIPIVIFVRKRKENAALDVEGNKIKKANALAKKYLSEAKKHLKNKEPFYIALEKAMHNFLKAKLSIETTEMSKVKIAELLQNREANPETIKEFIDLTENCEIARYAQSTNVKIQNDYEKAVQIILDLEKQLK